MLIYEQAENLAASGKVEEALNICWELRLRPDLGLFRRASVNLLIGMLLPEKTQIIKHANECLDLLQLLRAERTVDEETLDKELTPVEDLAGRLLRQTETKARLPTPQDGGSQSDLQGSIDEDMDIEEGLEAQIRSESIQIEGYLRDDWVMDHAHGKPKGAEGVEGESKPELSLVVSTDIWCSRRTETTLSYPRPQQPCPERLR